MESQAHSRRRFLGQACLAGAATAMSAKSYAQVQGANERVQVGLIGFGLMGRVHARSFLALKDSRLVAVSDAYRPRMQACRDLADRDLKQHADFRRLLEDREVEAVVVATPDHWHALHCMMACATGKDVYVEKPLHLFVREGEGMKALAERHKRVVQVGTQQRSAPHYRKAKDLLLSGAIGDLVSVQCQFFRNITPGIGRPPDGPPPADLDWEMWQGPAPFRPYNPNRSLYHFRWFWDYSGGQMTNLGHHSLDILHWVYNLRVPHAVSSSGGRFHLKDNAEVPDTQDAILEYPGFNALVQIRECAAGGVEKGQGSLTFHGTKGTLLLGREGYEIRPDPKIEPANAFAGMMSGGGHPIGGPQPVEETQGDYWTEKLVEKTGDAKNQPLAHARDFLDCVKSRKQPASDLASSHEVSTACHLANLSMRLGRKLHWDSAKEDIVNDPEASALLRRAYRAPWDGELKRLLP